jgi:hypothetical protein
MNAGTSQLCSWSNIRLKFCQLHENSGCLFVLGFGTRKIFSKYGSSQYMLPQPPVFSFWHYRHVFGLFTDYRLAAETLNTQPWAWENMDWTQHQSGASSIARCKSFQNHGMKLIWIVNVNFDSFLKCRQFVSFSDGNGNRYFVAILQQCYWNDLCVRKVYSVFFKFCSCLFNHVSSSDSTYTVTKQVGSGWLVFSTLFKFLLGYRLL